MEVETEWGLGDSRTRGIYVLRIRFKTSHLNLQVHQNHIKKADCLRPLLWGAILLFRVGFPPTRCLWRKPPPACVKSSNYTLQPGFVGTASFNSEMTGFAVRSWNSCLSCHVSTALRVDCRSRWGLPSSAHSEHRTKQRTQLKANRAENVCRDSNPKMYTIYQMCWDVPFPPEEGGAGTYAEMSERRWTWETRRKGWLFSCLLVISGKINFVPIFLGWISPVEEKQSHTFLLRIKICGNSQSSISRLKYVTSYTTNTKGFSNYVFNKSKWLQITGFKTTVYSICLQALKRWLYEVKLSKIIS